MILTILVFIFILGLLIFVHELGHFISAKKAGIKVEEFGFGLPPRIWGIKKGETIYSINWLPLGGFVRLMGEEGEKRWHTRSFCAKPISIRFVVLCAGVAMNFLLAVFLLMAGHSIGLPTAIDDGMDDPRATYRNVGVQIIQVALDSPAEKAGLKMGDTILSVSYQEEFLSIKNIEDVQSFVAGRKGNEIELRIKRGAEILDINLVPRVNPPEGEGAMGIAMAKTAIISYPWYWAIRKGIESAAVIVYLIAITFLSILKDLIFAGKFAGDISGPVGIAVLTSQFTKLGFVYLLQFTALLSINLAIINILPFPALDGGRALFLVIEKIKGGPVSERVERAVHTAGFVFLIGLMILITLRDVIRFF